MLEESLSASLAEIKRMKTLVQEMLDLSRAPQVREQYKDAKTEVVATLEQIVTNFKNTLSRLYVYRRYRYEEGDYLSNLS